MSTKSLVEDLLARENGIFRLEPAWVARDFLPPGRRLGLREDEYDVGERGYICERWLGSITRADNAVGPEDEGLSYLQTGNGVRITLKDAVDAQPALMMGADYASGHANLGRLVKIYDFGARIPYHLHQLEKDAKLVGRNSKDEACYYLDGVDPGPHPETFFGVHPYIAEEKQHEILLPYLEDWDSDLILRHSFAYLNVRGEGFFLPSGIPHAPGTALTLELQEDSDVFAMMQALNAGKIISKKLLYKDVRREDRERLHERVILGQIDWEESGDHYFYENHHLAPRLVAETDQPGGTEYWIYYDSPKFSGKKLVIPPGGSFTSIDRGVYNVFVWKGEGEFDGKSIKAGEFGEDELLVTYRRAIEPVQIRNTGTDELVLFKFFGPGINSGVAPIINQRGR
ncbi:MAG: hypothetical protein KOO61_01610 [Spirochaetales bacterium]|nr:hypothetical protein [Spirochaetales bacterium]